MQGSDRAPSTVPTEGGQHRREKSQHPLCTCGLQGRVSEALHAAAQGCAPPQPGKAKWKPSVAHLARATACCANSTPTHSCRRIDRPATGRQGLLEPPHVLGTKVAAPPLPRPYRHELIGCIHARHAQEVKGKVQAASWPRKSHCCQELCRQLPAGCVFGLAITAQGLKAGPPATEYPAQLSSGQNRLAVH